MTYCAAASSPAMAAGGGQTEQQKGGQVSKTVLDDRWYMASLDALVSMSRPVVVM